MPVVALRDGGHPELVREAGELFDDYSEIPGLLDKVCANYDSYQDKMNLESIEQIAKRYYEFMDEVYTNKQQGRYSAKHLTMHSNVAMYVLLMKIRIKDKLMRISNNGLSK